MKVGRFYFIEDDFLERYNLSMNKGIGHDRPFFCCYEDKFDPKIKWVIPLYSNVERYEEIYNRQIRNFGKCDSIDFSYLFNRKSVFKINAAFPITQNHIKNIYINPETGKDVTMNWKDQKRITNKLKKNIVLQGRGRHIFYNDVHMMRKQLLTEINQKEPMNVDEGEPEQIEEDILHDLPINL